MLANRLDQCLTEELRELRKREKEQGIQSNWEIDSFMAADALEGKREAIVSEYMLRILGLDVSTDLPADFLPKWSLPV